MQANRAGTARICRDLSPAGFKRPDGLQCPSAVGLRFLALLVHQIGKKGRTDKPDRNTDGEHNNDSHGGLFFRI